MLTPPDNSGGDGGGGRGGVTKVFNGVALTTRRGTGLTFQLARLNNDID